MEIINEKLNKLPEDPGVYIMKNSIGEIIYVGKAKNLKKRVRQYFQNKNQAPKVALMVSNIEDFEYIVVSNEVEALVLEATLIKEERPKYNILLRDDKQYPYIKITRERFPKVIKTRKVIDDGGTYYGPYPNAYAVNDFLNVIGNLTKTRTCNRNLDIVPTKERPCLNAFINRCMAPCTGNVTDEEYGKVIKEIDSILRRKSKKFEEMLEAEMKREAENLNFEKAAAIRDSIQAVQLLFEEQKVVSTKDEDRDVLAIARGTEEIIIQVFFIRTGKILGREYFVIDNSNKETDKEVISSFIKQFYIGSAFIPSEILTEIEPEDLSAIEEWLSEKRGGRVEVRTPKKGEKLSLIRMVKDNANLMMAKHGDRFLKEARKNRDTLVELSKLLKINNEIKRIEAFDISNIQGVDNVGAMIVFENAMAKKSDYRRFKIRGVSGQDDYASMEEMLFRRFSKLLNEKEVNESFYAVPDLIFMDGGKGHVNTCKKVLNDLGLKIPVAGLVKDESHTTRGIIYENEEYFLPVDSDIYRLVYKVQEEVHRFAIQYHRSLRNKNLFKSELDEIPFIGNKRKIALLEQLGSIDAIKKASLEELLEVRSMDKRAAKSIYEHFRR